MEWKRHRASTSARPAGKAAVNALQLKSMLKGGPVKVPELLVKRYWELEEIAEKTMGS
jgi:hypothetical protein